MDQKYFDFIKNYPNFFINEKSPYKIIFDAEIIRKWESEQANKNKIGIIYQDEYISILRDLVEFPNQNRRGYFRIFYNSSIKGSGSVAIFPIFNNKIVLLKIYRHATRSWHLEIPRGFGELGKKPKEQAIIEIKEELGAKITEIISLGSFYPNTGIDSESVNLFLCKIETLGEVEINEGIQFYQLVDVDDFQNLVRNNKIQDSFTIVAYMKAITMNII